ncbi:putative versicolorin B synthase [Phaeosphaeriaceae sp. PMI808]|nr:putative versicolorin B synthase [Phaeosphaeriaceae sp. PMI808]
MQQFARALLSLLALSSYSNAYSKGKVQDQTFEYVIVGGGTAGIPVGTRLAAAGFKVAILEAGGFYEDSEPILATTPAFDFQPNTANDWAFETVPQLGLNGRKLPYPRGKCMSGTSGRNAMIWQKGPKGAFQMWADEVGDQSYALEELEGYLKRAVTFTPPNTATRAANATPGYDPSVFASANGPLSVTYANWAVAFSSWARRAMQAVGIKDAGDFDNGKIMGSQYMKLTIDASLQQRASSESAYLSAFNDLPNLTIFTHTIGSKVLFNKYKKVTGVVAENTGIPFTLTVKNEVILSGGAFHSPQLLMLSGIGPAEILSEYDIPMIHDNPHVGQNLSDHVWFGASVRTKLETASRWNDDLGYRLQAFQEFSQNHRGPLTSNGGDFAAFEKVPDELRKRFTDVTLRELSAFPNDWPDIEYVVAPTFLGDFHSPQPNDGYQYASIAAALMTPISRGNITIQSSSIHDPPLINPAVLVSHTDQQVAIAAFKRLRQMLASPELAPIRIGDEYYPGKKVQDDDASILEHLKDAASVYYHAGGTCKMGDPEKPETAAVVDNKARVVGVKGVRVVDASVLPFLIPSHIQSAIYALAEKIADNIIQDAKTRWPVVAQQELKA